MLLDSNAPTHYLLLMPTTTRIKLLPTEFAAWARSAGFVCRRAVGRVFYGSTVDGDVRAELVNDGVSLRDRYQAGWREMVEAPAVEAIVCQASELDGMFSMEAMFA